MKKKTIKIEMSELPYSVHDNAEFDYCRQLIKEGEKPGTRLEIYRNGVPALYINKIGSGAKLTTREEPTVHFHKYEPFYKEAMEKLRKRRARPNLE